MISHKKKFGVYHWDTFDNETFLQYQNDDYEKCLTWIKKHYGDRLRDSGADKVEIVDDKGDVIKQMSVG